jgi:hypothetical protein
MMGDNYWPYGIDRSKARDAHPLAEAASVDAVTFNHPKTALADRTDSDLCELWLHSHIPV